VAWVAGKDQQPLPSAHVALVRSAHAARAEEARGTKAGTAGSRHDHGQRRLGGSQRAEESGGTCGSEQAPLELRHPEGRGLGSPGPARPA
jgi:hypothetical protein